MSINDLKNFLPETDPEILEWALQAADGNFQRAVNMALDREIADKINKSRHSQAPSTSAAAAENVDPVPGPSTSRAFERPPIPTQRVLSKHRLIKPSPKYAAANGFSKETISCRRSPLSDNDRLRETPTPSSSISTCEREDEPSSSDAEIRETLRRKASSPDENRPKAPGHISSTPSETSPSLVDEEEEDDVDDLEIDNEHLENEPSLPVISEDFSTVPPNPVVHRAANKNEFTIAVKVHTAVSQIPISLMKEDLESILQKCLIEATACSRQSYIPRAEYEEQAVEWRIELKLGGNGDRKLETLLLEFLERYCYFSTGYLHEQFLMEVPQVPKIVNIMSPQYINVPIATIAVGNCPNPGLFFVRGNYVTSYNCVSNKTLLGRNESRRRDDVSQYRATGNQPYLSFAIFEHDRRQMTLYFAVDLNYEQEDGLTHAGYRLSVNYSSIVQIVADLRDSKLNSLFLKLKYPPTVWQAFPRGQPFQHKSRRILNLEQTRDWGRVLEWAGDSRSSGCSRDALADCQWLQIQIPKKNDHHGTSPSNQFIGIVARLMARSAAKVYFGAVVCQLKRLPVVYEVPSMNSFRADYALKALISRGSVVTDQLFDYFETDHPSEHMFFKIIRWCMQECSRACEEALENLLCAVDERRCVDVTRAFSMLYKIRADSYRRLAQGIYDFDSNHKRLLPKNCVLIRKVMITPLRTLFMAPEVMMTNRVVRRFGAENALRCVFREDSGGKLITREFGQGTMADQQTAIAAEIVHRTLSHGVHIHDRHYHFLAWSNSQMRDHGCYMYAPVMDPVSGEVLISIEQMRQWMGDFSSSKNVPKMMSRMGQCFTQAQPTILMEPEMWGLEDDFEGGIGHPDTGEPYCFSDGCGRISGRLARKISEMLELTVIPSCFQVRFKGFKGVLAIDPVLDLSKSKKQIIFRKSQKKFSDSEVSDSNYLEIVKYAMPSPVCLNRPLITILDQVAEKQSSDVHLKLCRKIHYYLEKELSQLGAMLLNEKAAAEQLSQRITLPMDFTWLKHCGFTLTNEPFIRQMLVSIYRYNINNQLAKSKIFLPSAMGRSMYGLVDETGLLQYGQVFVQMSPSIRKSSENPKLILGPVLITKNPCHVAGDVRMFEAVDQPALRHLFDVIVFPRYGPRPHPDEMAGSDLDGDEYSIIFDSDIRFLYNEEAMIFPKSKPAEADGPPNNEDMVDFFLKYLRQDSIGRMSNAHLAMADREGLFSEVSNNIAKKCSIAVDFPKSGDAAEPLTQQEQCDVMPDYMGHNVKPLYRSQRLNGQLYRKVRKVEEVLELSEGVHSIFEDYIDRQILPVDKDLFEAVPELKAKYRQLRDDYAVRMQQLLDEYGISDEAAIVSGHIVSLKRLAAMERDDYSFYHTDKIVELRYEKIYYQFRSEFFAEFGGELAVYESDGSGNPILRSNRLMELKARRWYQLAYADSHRKRAPGPCRSFPWIVWDVLAAYKRDLLFTAQTVEISDCPMADALNSEITDFILRNSQDYEEFAAELSEMTGVIHRYTVAYGQPLSWTLYILQNWLNKEDIFNYTPLKMRHVALMFIQFARGQQQSCDGVADTAPTNIFMPLKAPDPPVFLGCSPFNISEALFSFLRYLASQRFALANKILLGIDDEKPIPILLRSDYWVPLSQLAFRAYHHIAVAGRFDALCLGEQTADWSEGESKDPMVVPSALLYNNSYNQAPIPSQKVLDTLKAWTGVSSIHARYLNQCRRNNDVVLFTSVGTVASRHRLARLLLMPVDRLLSAIREDRIPIEVRDQSF